MHKLSFWVIFLSVLWGGYWYGGSQLLKKGAADFLATRSDPNAPIHLIHNDLSVKGFPASFSTEITDVIFQNKRSGILWNGANTEMKIPSYKPYQATLVLPEKQTLQLYGQTYQISNIGMNASLGLAFREFFNGAAIIDYVSGSTKGLWIKAGPDWNAKLEGLTFTAKLADAETNRYDLNVRVLSFLLPDQMHDTIDPMGRQTSIIHSLQIDSAVTYNAPWDFLDTSKAPPQISGINLAKLWLVWDAAQILCAGDLQVNSQGYPEGVLDITVINWQVFYQMAKDTNLIKPEYSQSLLSGLKAVAITSQNANTIKVPLKFADGQMSMVGFPLGPAPRIR